MNASTVNHDDANDGTKRGAHRRPRRQPYSWLGIGALSLGVGAALATGSGLAHADTPSGSSSTGGHTARQTTKSGVAAGPSARKPSPSPTRALTPTAAIRPATGNKSSGTTSSIRAGAVSPVSNDPSEATTLPGSPTAPAKTPAAAFTPASVLQIPASLPSPVQVLRALGFVPRGPLAPMGNPIQDLLWGWYRQTQSLLGMPQTTARTTALVAAPTSTTPTVTYSVASDWGSGHTGSMTVTAGQALNGWTVEFDSPAQITNIWNAQITSHIGTHYVITNMAYNGTVAAGQSTTFGYQATPGALAATPTNLKVNGVAVSTPPTTPTLSVADTTVAEGNSGTTNATFTVTLSKPSTTPVTVNYSTSNGTATASDFTATTGTLTFAAGVTTQTITAKVTGDTTVEPNETFTVSLASPAGATLSRATATATITNDDVVTVPSVSIADTSVAEGNSGSSNATFTVTLSQASTTPVTVNYSTSSGTATAPGDFTAATGTLTFAAGVTSQTITVKVTGDTTVESSETFTVSLASPAGATISRTTATATITNDDVATPVPGNNSVTYAVVDDWGSGHTANMTVTAGQALKSWTVEFDSAAQITGIWNAQIASHVGTHYVITNMAYNGAVAAGQSMTFGYQATPGAAASTPTNLKVNGVAVSTPPTTPSLSIADTTVAEGNSGTSNATFTVTLSKPSTTPVTVNYSTSSGTATAGNDFTATTGTLTFAAGATSQTITVKVTGDTAIEPNETFTVALVSPAGATITRATATATITNDDVTTTPGLSISDASVTEPGAGGMAPGFLHTSGNQILDSQGKPVQISGVNWFGAEGSNGVPDGLWTRSYKDMIDQMSAQGFNTIRLPYSSEMLHTTSAPSGINYNLNPDLQGLSRLQVLDQIINYAGQDGMRVILDHHRSTAGAGTSENGLWYNSQYTEDQWVSDWQMLANRYKNNPTVIGLDLHNEPYNGTWGGGGVNDWARAAERAGNAVLQSNPNLLIFVEGVGTYQGQSYWWGGNLMGVKDRPIVLNVPNHVVYSPHDYPNSVYNQTWFQSANFGANLPNVFRQAWGYIYEDGIAPIYVGEFGTKLQDPKDAVWLEALTSYLSGDFDNNGTVDIPAGTEDMSWTFWSWNPNSGDTGGILADDWRTINQNKMVYLTPIEFTSGSGTSLASFVVTLASASTQTVTVQYATSNGTATAGLDYLSVSGTLNFAPGETQKIITVPVKADSLAEAIESFTLLLSNPSGTTITDGSGAGTIINRSVA
ncbi:Calx-beta domain-containing protein [Mycobacterium sp. RTGN5]|uniref:Calx-beta domain-containing protein n=1 Tax=Mycobacterium sp. RTGN5 TaxID=3016522 RepID=UPI0029C67965|nr:Calx-beta domain-containing protein [Mycobacterium sp. RTGN5]